MLKYLVALIFFTALSFFWLVYLLFFQRKDQIKSRLAMHTGLEEDLRLKENGVTDKLTLGQQLGKAYAHTDIYRKQKKLIAQAYVKMKPEELVSITLMSGTILAMLFWVLQGNVLTALLGFLLGLFLPAYSLRIIGMRRAKQLNKQLPQALALISNGLRAGFSFPQAMGIVTREMEAPLADEFGKVLHDSQLGKPMDEALRDFNDRTNDEDLSIFITTLLTQMSVGGDLAEILDIIAETIRERIHLQGHIRTLTSQSKFSAIVISVLPLGIGIILFFMNPEYIGTLFTDPLGLAMVGAAGVMMLLGFIALYKIVHIKV